MLDLVGNPEDRFSHNEAHLIGKQIVWCGELLQVIGEILSGVEGN